VERVKKGTSKGNFKGKDWKEKLFQLGISPEGIEKGERFICQLEKWSKVHNLTNYTGNRLGEQLVDSYYPFAKWKLEPRLVVDVGTGAGFPGLAVALFRPETKFYLIEPRQKRVSFLTYIKILLNLSNVEVVQSRVEQFTLSNPVDLLISRAVGNWEKIMKLSRHLLIPRKSNILLYRGNNFSPPPFPFKVLTRSYRFYLLFPFPHLIPEAQDKN